MTTTQIHQHFSGPMMEMTIEPDITLTVGRSREMDDCVAIAVRVTDGLTAFVTIPKDEFLRAADTVRSLL